MNFHSLEQLNGLVNILSDGGIVLSVLVQDVSPPVQGQVLGPLLVAVSLLVAVLQVGDLLSYVVPQPAMIIQINFALK